MHKLLLTMTTFLTVSGLRAEESGHAIMAQQMEEGFGEDERKRCADHKEVRDSILDQVNTLENLTKVKGMLLGLEFAKKSSSECAIKIENSINKIKTDFKDIYSQDVDKQIKDTQKNLVQLMDYQRCLSSSDIQRFKIQKEYSDRLEKITFNQSKSLREDIDKKIKENDKLRKDIK